MTEYLTITREGKTIALPATKLKALYKYFPPENSTKFSKENLTRLIINSEIRMTGAAEVNDPTDCNPEYVDDLDIKTLRTFLQYVKDLPPTTELRINGREEFLKKYPNDKAISAIRRVPVKMREAFRNTTFETFRKIGFTCFSENGLSPLMWAHYGQSHAGVCVEFKTNAKEIKSTEITKIPISAFSLDMIYTDSRPKLKIKQNLPKTNIEVLKKAVETKSTVWEYENEWRFFGRSIGDNQIYECGEWVPIGDDAIKSITLGIKATEETEIFIRNLLEKSGQKISIYRAAFKQGSFNLKRTKI